MRKLLNIFETIILNNYYYYLCKVFLDFKRVSQIIVKPSVNQLELSTQFNQLCPLCNVEDFGNCIDCNLIFSPISLSLSSSPSLSLVLTAACLELFST